ncbi:MAG: hypothetical protein JOS17DRAFT_116698 [Linnemannia elongata]|nr:MAG: hypothetical protein JOS17DRAFT_116698 [Linnemannia elongata]
MAEPATNGDYGGRPVNQRYRKPSPPYRGPDGSVEKYVNARQEMETVLYDFHNKPAIKKNAWNAQRAKEQEFRLVADRLLQMIGGCTGAKRQDDNFVIIGEISEICCGGCKRILHIQEMPGLSGFRRSGQHETTVLLTLQKLHAPRRASGP